MNTKGTVSLFVFTLLLSVSFGRSLSLDPNQRSFYEEDWEEIPHAFVSEVVSTSYEIRKDNRLIEGKEAGSELSKLANDGEFRTINETFSFKLIYELKVIEDFKGDKVENTEYDLSYECGFLVWMHFMNKRPEDGEKKVFMYLEKNRLFADPTNESGWRYFDEDIAAGIRKYLEEKDANKSAHTTSAIAPR